MRIGNQSTPCEAATHRYPLGLRRAQLMSQEESAPILIARQNAGNAIRASAPPRAMAGRHYRGALDWEGAFAGLASKPILPHGIWIAVGDQETTQLQYTHQRPWTVGAGAKVGFNATSWGCEMASKSGASHAVAALVLLVIGRVLLVYLEPSFPKLIDRLELLGRQFQAWLEGRLGGQLSDRFWVPLFVSACLAFAWGGLYHWIRHGRGRDPDLEGR